MQILYTSRKGDNYDLSSITRRLDWKGDYQQAARSITLQVVVSEQFSVIKQMLDAVDNGEMLRLLVEDVEVFRGYIFTHTRGVQDDLRTFTAYDAVMHMNKSSLSQNFIGMNAQKITKQVCGMFGIPIGSMPPDGSLALSYACIQKTAYAAIMGAWTQVAKASGKKYMPRMTGQQLSVIEMGARTAVHVLSPDVNLVEGEITRSIEDAVTRALIVDEKGAVLDSAINNAERLKYGMLQTVEQGEKGKLTTKASLMLKGEETEITLQKVLGGIGATALIAGNACVVEDPGTGLYGKFYILEDSHSFEDGAHEITLTIAFEAVMSEEEITEIKAAKSTGKTDTVLDVPGGDPWATAAAYGATP